MLFYPRSRSTDQDAATVRERGMTFMDVLIGMLLLSLVFYGLFGAFRLSIQLIALSKARSGALALSTEQLEYVRSLPYRDVGTVSGIPDGVIPPVDQASLNHATYTRRTFIQYVDDPQDGEGGDDENGITADYKRVKVEVSWWMNDATSSVAMVTNVVPRGIETLGSGGTIRVNVIDAAVAPVASAEVHVLNTSLATSVDTTTFTNVDGEVLFPGAYVGSGYEIFISKPGYSSAQTYSASSALPDPSPAHQTVTEDETTTITFAIDETAELVLRTLEPVTEGSFDDSLDSADNFDGFASTTLSGGALVLTDTAGVYDTQGYATTSPLSVDPLNRWLELSWDTQVSANTELRVRLYHSTTSGVELIPDSDLPGNSEGTTTSPVDLSELNPTAYQSLVLVPELTTSDTSETPELLSWALSYEEGPTPIANADVALTSSKTIGTDDTGSPVPKHELVETSDANGEIVISDLEWDTYTIAPEAAYDVSQSCPPPPHQIDPGAEVERDLTLVADTANSLLVVVRESGGAQALLEDATAVLSGNGATYTGQTDSCGQAFFQGIGRATSTLVVGHPSFATTTGSLVDHSDDDEYVGVPLSP